jgi:hypothetical protein
VGQTDGVDEPTFSVNELNTVTIVAPVLAWLLWTLLATIWMLTGAQDGTSVFSH